MLVHIVWYFLLNRLTGKPVTEPGGPVVSLTTYGTRSRKAYLAIESIAQGRLRPSRLILWIDDENLFRVAHHGTRSAQVRADGRTQFCIA